MGQKEIPQKEKSPCILDCVMTPSSEYLQGKGYHDNRTVTI